MTAAHPSSNPPIAVISGGASGIGKAVAETLAAEGMHVVVADVSPGSGSATVDHVLCDVTNPQHIDALYAHVTQTYGHPDLLVCCAGRGIHEKLTEGDPAKWQAVLDLNLMGPLRLIRAFTPGMLQKGAGDVVILSSVSAGQTYAYGGIYAASKTALNTIAETLRQETVPVLRVLTVAPGVTDTHFFENTISGYNTVESIGYGALSADEVAQTVLFALKQPRHVSLNHLTIRPTPQPF
ncbi:SDR family oxidoreductase [Rufibacter glacialis]|uniref:SDR family NAD(P)-dependent oxidoreductase n=1 Tax=Rufibacter glacialis TaxID=1259555 RepID=A0A5M8QMW7_9BACT|nr:SDR family NAD(P)-dependent oxidoreductase [Rufibacter glacialis]KAA6435552.1 SDR family NAD(P)-dependent oxidoreductase [Rufibacter glacialis]GGK64508.1 oxidoreductase [Rufibacter glacialis]